MLSSVVISSLILIFIIIKYAYFHISAEKNAAKRLVWIIKNINTKQHTLIKKQQHKIKSIIRPFINPLKGSHNVDLIREILSSDAVMEHFLYKHGKFILEQPKETGKKKDKKQE